MALSKQAEDVIPFFPNADQFYQTCLPQEFSLPIPTMKYIWTNPSSSEAYQKLIQCCKLFFIKNPILVIHSLKYFYYNGWKYCPGSKCESVECEYNGYQKLDVNNVRSKIWLTKELDFFVSSGTLSKAVSDLFPKIYRCNLETLELHLQKLTFNELKFLSNGVKHCNLNKCLVEYDNGKQTPLEGVIKLFGGCKTFSISFSPCHTAICETSYEIVAVCKTIEKIKFTNFPTNFDISQFYQCLKISKTRTLIEIYADNHSNRYAKIIDEILNAEFFDFVPPVIYTHVHGSNIFGQMRRIQEKQAAKIS